MKRTKSIRPDVEPAARESIPDGQVSRIAVASADGKMVHEHFGRASQFLIFEVEGSLLKFCETRAALAACGPDGHDQRRFEDLVELISDCDAVLVAEAGPAAKREFARRGIDLFVCREFIIDAIRDLLASGQLRAKTNSAHRERSASGVGADRRKALL